MATETTTDLKAPNLTKEFPRSPRETLGGYVIAGRTLDKCRAAIAGTLGDYHFDCPLDNIFFEFAGIRSEDFKNFVTTGASDEEVADWIVKHAKERPQIEVIKWNNKHRDMRISEMPDKLQEFLEGYIAENLPKGRPVYAWFDVYDIEEKRL